MNALAKKYPKVLAGARGRGLMLGMEFPTTISATTSPRTSSARGILISGTYINARVLRVEPPLTISYPEIDKFLAALEASLGEVQKEHRL